VTAKQVSTHAAIVIALYNKVKRLEQEIRLAQQAVEYFMNVQPRAAQRAGSWVEATQTEHARLVQALNRIV
jgi:hypothetical protein